MVTEAGDQYGSLDEIRQRLAAVDVMARYAAGIDRADWPLVESCFDPAANIRGTRMEARFAEYFPVLRVEIEKFERTFHFLGNQRVRLGDQSTWLETYAVARHFWTNAQGEPMQMTIGVRYFDEFHRTERGWVIADRAVDLDWTDTNPPSAGVTWTVPDRGRQSISEEFG